VKLLAISRSVRFSANGHKRNNAKPVYSGTHTATFRKNGNVRIPGVKKLKNMVQLCFKNIMFVMHNDYVHGIL